MAEGCGNGVLESELSEFCDDNGTASADGCSPTCTVEVGWFCDGASPTVCTRCSEGCNICSDATTCTICASTHSLNDTSCVEKGCGNSLIELGEDCDDGDEFSLDGCSLTCEEEDGWFCIGEPSVCLECSSDCKVCSDASTCTECDS